MTIPSDFVEANRIMLQSYSSLAAADALPPAKLAQLETILSGLVPPERVSEFFEFGYANRAQLDGAARSAFADIGNFAWMNGWWGLAADSRGLRMEALLRGVALPDGVTEPEPSSKYVQVEPTLPGDATV